MTKAPSLHELDDAMVAALDADARRLSDEAARLLSRARRRYEQAARLRRRACRLPWFAFAGRAAFASKASALDRRYEVLARASGAAFSVAGALRQAADEQDDALRKRRVDSFLRLLDSLEYP
jgi:hypothetical protein